MDALHFTPIRCQAIRDAPNDVNTSKMSQRALLRKHAYMLGKEEEWHVGTIKINLTEICLNNHHHLHPNYLLPIVFCPYSNSSLDVSKRYKIFFDEIQGKYGYLFGHLTTRFMPRRKFNELARHLQDIMMESLPKMVDECIKKILQGQVPLHVRENFRSEIFSQVNDAITNHIPLQVDSSVRSYMSGGESAKSQKRSKHGTFVFGESSSSQDYKSEPGPSTSGNQDQSDDFYFWTNSYATDDDVLLNEKVSQELVDEMSQTVDEGKLRKVVNEMKEIIVPPYQSKPTPVVQSCQRDPKAPALSLVNQDLLYLKKGNTRPEKIALSLHKFPTVRFLDNDIEERTSRWVTKCVKKFNPYARYDVEHWKNSHANIFYIRKQQEPKKPKEEVYSNSKIVQTIKTYWELGHEYKFITEIVARRENGSIVSITESDYKNLNKNDTKDMYLLIINHKVDDYADWIVVFIISLYQEYSIEKYKVFSIIFEPVYGIIYKNSKKEKRVMRHQEVYKFCDATLKRFLKGLKSYNNDVKYCYVTHNLSKEDDEYLQLFAEEIEEWLKYHDQMRRWESYVNGRPLGSRRERPE
ncbi:hypothetical protein Tco_0418131 [Tanacetum coccineum]